MGAGERGEAAGSAAIGAGGEAAVDGGQRGEAGRWLGVVR